ncbi:unnamed protein product, partial [Polarella glacialis]
AHAAAKNGLNNQGGGLLEAITGGLQVRVDSIDVRVERCGCQRVPPFLACHLDDVFYGPVDPRIERLVRHSPSDSTGSVLKEVQVAGVELSVDGGKGIQPFVRPVAIHGRFWRFMPSDGRTHCPFYTASRIELDLRAIHVQASDEQVLALS